MSTDKNPFVGLRPFESRDSLYYFGRNQQTMELLKYLSQTRFAGLELDGGNVVLTLAVDPSRGHVVDREPGRQTCGEFSRLKIGGKTRE